MFNLYFYRTLVDSNDLKRYLREVLIEQDLLDQNKWISKASKNLSYKSKSLSRFILMLTAHDTISDPKNLGLIKIGTEGVSTYLTVEKWNSKGVATIEHVAPQVADSSWDKKLYEEDDIFQSIGNLTLLPTEINTSAGNKGWKEKLIYYKHLSEQDPDKLKELAIMAVSENIQLNKDTLLLLQSARYNDHIKSIVTLGDTIEWNAEFVNVRTKRFLEISFERLNKWLEV